VRAALVLQQTAKTYEDISFFGSQKKAVLLVPAEDGAFSWSSIPESSIWRAESDVQPAATSIVTEVFLLSLRRRATGSE